ncbi:hypothetical protein, partial [Yersinia mollaretii]|uniref:hypothetical protein n=1 Tax=Yersinia mollaretii TaxID=33060 RepID=UPI0011A629B4
LTDINTPSLGLHYEAKKCLRNSVLFKPLFDDVSTVKFLRLVRVLRRLRELQRAEVCVTNGKEACDA